MSAVALRIPASFWRFGLVGVGGLGVDMAALYGAIWGLGCSALTAKVFSFLLAASFTWWMNRCHTFGASGKPVLLEWGGFLGANAFGGAVNFALYTAIVTQSPPSVWLPALATAAGSLGGLLFNYLSARHLVFKRTRQAVGAAEVVPLPWIAYLLTLLVGLFFGGVALWLGMDANWDLRNYHWYNGWAFLNGMLGRDLLVSQTPSFYNPTLDAGYAWAVERLSARTIGFALGFLHGVNFLPLFAIGWRVCTLAKPRHRLLAAGTAALAGVAGAGGQSELGTVFYDNLLGLGVSASVLLVVSRWDTLARGLGRDCAAWALAAGLPAGLAFGLKQPMVVYCVGLCAAFLFADMRWPRRLWAGFWFGVGVLLGFALGGGHWAWHLWQAYGNPLFPYMNQIFHSPWGLPADYRDRGFLSHQGLADRLSFAYRFSFNPYLVGETAFRDFRILALVTAIPLAVLAWVWRQPAKPPARLGPAGWLLAAGLLVYATWLPMFSIYRYLVPLEMLAPLLVALAIGLLPLAEKTRGYAAVAVLGLLASTTVPGDWLRTPWADQAVPVAVPAIARPEQTLVLLSGFEPLSYLVPAFPKAMRFYRIDSNYRLPDDPGQGFRRLFREAIAQHLGPIASLHKQGEQDRAVEKLADYGLELDRSSCLLVDSPIAIGVGGYAYCLAQRIDVSRAARKASPPS